MKIIVNSNDLKIKRREFLAKKYKDCFSKACEIKDIKKIIFYGIKYISYMNYRDCYIEDVYEALDIIDMLESFVGFSSFYVMLNLFPITKEFDGEKFECKDYFSTMDYLKDKELSNMIMFYSLDDFFMNYYNLDIIKFNVNKFMLFDRVAKFNGQETLMERFAKEFNLDTYSRLNENTFINNRTNEIINVKKKENENE